MEINHFKPHSPEYLLENYKEIREPNVERDEYYSPLSDAIMSAIRANLEEHNPECIELAWTGSLFPERLTKEILRIVEKQIILLENGTY